MRNLPKAVCALIFNPTTQQLVVVSRKDNLTSFGLPGGKVDPGETIIEAICREVQEETGLTITSDHLHLIFETLCPRHAPEGTDYYAYGFVATAYEGNFASKEQAVVRWGSWEDLAQGAFAEYNDGFKKAYFKWKNNQLNID